MTDLESKAVQFLLRLPHFMAESLGRHKIKDFGDWSLAYSNSKDPYANAVYPRIEDPKIDQEIIEELLSFRQQEAVDFLWSVSPYSPSGLEELFQRSKGRFLFESVAFLLPISHIDPTPVKAERLHSHSVKDDKQAFVTCVSESFQMDRDNAKSLCEETYFVTAKSGINECAFFTDSSGEPIGFCGYLICEDFPELAYSSGLGIRPSFQKMGYSYEIINYMIKELQTRRIQAAVASANKETSYPIVKKLGAKSLYSSKFYGFFS